MRIRSFVKNHRYNLFRSYMTDMQNRFDTHMHEEKMNSKQNLRDECELLKAQLEANATKFADECEHLLRRAQEKEEFFEEKICTVEDVVGQKLLEKAQELEHRSNEKFENTSIKFEKKLNYLLFQICLI